MQQHIIQMHYSKYLGVSERQGAQRILYRVGHLEEKQAVSRLKPYCTTSTCSCFTVCLNVQYTEVLSLDV